jgi:transcriptional regulator with XRE-family HTH domain
MRVMTAYSGKMSQGSRSTASGDRKDHRVTPQQTALGRLLQERREAAGYSRARAGELVGIKSGTIEGWELGRVARPPVHDVLRLAHFLAISAEEITAAVFEDAGAVEVPADRPGAKERKGGRRRRSEGAVPLLEAAYRLFGWKDDDEAARALNATAEQVRRWRSGAEAMAFADFLTLTSMIGVAAAEAMRGGDARIADLSAAAEALGVSSGVSRE